MSCQATAERKAEAEDQMLDLYVHLLYHQEPDAVERESRALAQPCPYCGGTLVFRRPVLSCARCGARVTV